MANFYAVRYGSKGSPLAWDSHGGEAVSPNSGHKEWHRSEESANARAEKLMSYGHEVVQVLKIVSQTKRAKTETIRYGY